MADSNSRRSKNSPRDKPDTSEASLGNSRHFVLAAPQKADPPRRRPLLLAVSVVLLLAWVIFLLVAAISVSQ